MDDALPAVLDEVVIPDKRRSVRARRAAELIRDATAARWVGIYTVAAGTVSNEAWSGTGPPVHPTFPATEGLTAHAIAARAVALSNDVAADPRYLTNQADTGSELIIPIFTEHRVLGTLDIESGDVGAFSGTVIAHYETLAQALRPLWDDAELGAGAPAI